MAYVFNPFTGTLDWTVAAAPAGVPTEMLAAETFTVPARVQQVFRQKIVMGAGAVISLAAGASLVGV